MSLLALLRTRQSIVLVGFFWSLSVRAANCERLIEESPGAPIHIAASSVERGYAFRDTPEFDAEITTLVSRRAQEFCVAYQCGNLVHYQTELLDLPGVIRGVLPARSLVTRRISVKFEDHFVSKPWVYGTSSYRSIGNCMWYAGHCISGLAGVHSVINRSWQSAVTSLVFGFSGQTLTMLSRWVERREPAELSHQEAFSLDERPHVKIFRVTEEEVPHLIFSSIVCDPGEAQRHEQSEDHERVIINI